MGGIDYDVFKNKLSLLVKRDIILKDPIGNCKFGWVNSEIQSFIEWFINKSLNLND